MSPMPRYVSKSDPIRVWCSGEDWCAVTATATLIGRKWHTVIVDRLLRMESLGFNALRDAVDGISSKVLSDSLDELEEMELVTRSILSEKPFRVEYALTERGEDLEPVIKAMREWGQSHLLPADTKEESRI